MTNVLIPETDQQELWELSGRTNALRGMVDRRRRSMYSNIDLGDVEAIMGWDEPVRKNGHTAMEVSE